MVRLLVAFVSFFKARKACLEQPADCNFPVLPAQAQTRYMEALEKFGHVKEDVDSLLTKRDDAYLDLLAVPSPSGAPRLVRPQPCLYPS